MKFSNVHIPLPPSAAWPLLNDVPRIAQCLPGAELLESREDGTHQGPVKLRLGTIAQYARGGAIVEATAQVMIDDFAGNLEAMLKSETETAPYAASSPLEATRLMAGADADTQPIKPRQTEVSVLRLLWRTFLRLLSWARAGKP